MISLIYLFSRAKRYCRNVVVFLCEDKNSPYLSYYGKQQQLGQQCRNFYGSHFLQVPGIFSKLHHLVVTLGTSGLGRTV